MNPTCELEEGMHGLNINEIENEYEFDEADEEEEDGDEPYTLSELDEGDAPSQNNRAGYDSRCSESYDEDDDDDDDDDESEGVGESSSEDDEEDEADDDSINGESSLNNIYDYDGVEDDDKLYFEKYDYDVNSMCCRLNSTSDEYAACVSGGNTHLSYVITNPANCNSDNCFNKFMGNGQNLTKIESKLSLRKQILKGSTYFFF
jgi:hypothetical protein